MDRQSVYSLSVLAPDYGENEDSRGQIQAQLQNFILEFQLGNVFIYRSAGVSSFCEDLLMKSQRSNAGECPAQAILLRR
jgi:hypothetical protein